MKSGGKKVLQFGEMVEANKERGGKLYRQENAEYSRAVISEIVNGSIERLEAISQEDSRISLFDTEAVKKRTFLYLRSCEAAGTIPNFDSFCVSCGYTRRGVNKFIAGNPDHDSAKWLLLLKDTVAAALADAALGGHVNTIMAIFIEKSRHEWQDRIVIESETATPDPLGDVVSNEEIAERYRYLAEENG